MSMCKFTRFPGAGIVALSLLIPSVAAQAQEKKIRIGVVSSWPKEGPCRLSE
ncbi:MAG: hypothetical protein ISP45_23760 [Reyranella sp.]|jgi:hypothetical protein|nr:hypothetical protein [Reyranella sp.]